MNYAEKANSKNALKSIIYLGKVITTMKKQGQSKVIEKYAKSLVPVSRVLSG